MCFARGGKLPWSDPTACGHAPKYGPGGAMSHRLPGGETRRDKRVRDRARSGDERQVYKPPTIANPGNVVDCQMEATAILLLERYANVTNCGRGEVLRDVQQAARQKDLPRWWYRIASRVQEEAFLQSRLQGHVAAPPERAKVGRPGPSGKEDCEEEEAKGRLRDVRTNDTAGSPSPRRGCYEQRPGQPDGAVLMVSQEGTQARGVLGAWLLRKLLGEGLLLDALSALQEVWESAHPLFRTWEAPECSDVSPCAVGWGRMGSKLASVNEAPFPEQLAAFFVRSFCPPGGIVCDPFSGSGTTASMALEWGRKFVGCDLRESQVRLTKRRISETNRPLPGMF